MVAAVNSRARLRVWSLIITFFGDAIVPRGGAVSAKTVQEVLERLDIDPGATRTAFSRLTRDGWVVREKIGRSSFYHLSQRGAQPFQDATQRIYMGDPRSQPGPGTWLIGVPQPATGGSPGNDDIVFHKPNSHGGRETLVKENYLVLEGRVEHLPDWVLARLAPIDIRQGFEHLMQDLSALADAHLSPIDTLAARCLLIHEWRRLRLRLVTTEPDLLPPDWPLFACRDFVAKHYAALLPKSEDWLNNQAIGPQGTLPPAAAIMKKRFQ